MGWCLKVRKDGEEVEEIGIRADGAFTFGRNADACSIVLDHSSCSRVHAVLASDEDGVWHIADQGSTHGTLVDGVRCQPKEKVRLQAGSTLSFGASSRLYVLERRKRDADPLDPPVDPAKRPRAGPRVVTASHILAKHTGSRNPSSWRQSTITRSKEEACARIEAFRSELASVEASKLADQFARVASAESDCGSAKRGGNLGEFEHHRMQKAFSDCAFALAVGELSQLCDTDSGIHVLLRTA